MLSANDGVNDSCQGLRGFEVFGMLVRRTELECSAPSEAEKIRCGEVRSGGSLVALDSSSRANAKIVVASSRAQPFAKAES